MSKLREHTPRNLTILGVTDLLRVSGGKEIANADPDGCHATRSWRSSCLSATNRLDHHLSARNHPRRPFDWSGDLGGRRDLDTGPPRRTLGETSLGKFKGKVVSQTMQAKLSRRNFSTLLLAVPIGFTLAACGS